MSKTTRILICDDDPIVHQSLSLYLDHEDFLHDSAYDGKQALEMIKKEHYDLMLLDQMMPGMTGMEVCQAVRKDSQLPIIMLTARGEEIDRILGLEMGADDYIVKPFSPREVVSRIKAVLRRTCAAPDTAQEEKLTTLTFGSLEIQPERYSVKLAGQSIACTPREVELLYLLASHPGRVFDREQILSRIWGYDFFGDTRTVDTHIKRLRQKLSCDEMGQKWDIITVYGVGYKFEAEALIRKPSARSQTIPVRKSTPSFPLIPNATALLSAACWCWFMARWCSSPC